MSEYFKMIISKTPLRISFAGGGTDLASFYMYNGYGAVLSSSIDKYVYVTVKRHSELYDEKIRLNYYDTERVDNLENIEHPIIRECLKFLGIQDSLYISTAADVPGSSGLGSSSTFCVGLLKALYTYLGKSISRGRLAEEAAYVEIDVVGRPMGKQDHYAATFGDLNYTRFNDDGTCLIMPLSGTTGTKDITKTFFANLLTFWTGIERSSEEILTEQDQRAEENFSTLIKMRSQALELYELAKNGNLNTEILGNSLHKGWELKKTLASNISNALIEKAYQTALENGALGGKISGAGGGGFLNLVVPPPQQQTVISALEKQGLKYFPVNAETGGSTVHKLY